MEVVRRRVATRSVVAAGSVWERRMKMDEVNGGITVFNGEEDVENSEETDVKPPKRSIQKIARLAPPRPSGKRKTWKSDPSESFEKPRIQIARSSKDKPNSDEPVDVNRKNIVQRRTRSGVSTDEIQRSPSQLKKTKPEQAEFDAEKTSSEAVRSIDENKSANIDEKRQMDVEESKSDESCKNLGVCEENELIDSKLNADSDSDEADDIDAQLNIKEINIAEAKPRSSITKQKKTSNNDGKSTSPEQNLHLMIPEEEKISLNNLRSASPDSGVRMFHDLQETNNNLHYLVDLIMWRDVSKSALAFGFGTFFILSSSCAKDLNISLITVVSYMGLVYLAAIFLYRSIICRGAVEKYETSRGFVVEEEDAVWLLQLFLPYLNEFLQKLRNLFSGDPATTIKLAVLLYVLARCGSCITLWNLVKFGFVGAFTVPKIYSSYSSQLTRYVDFWVDRFADAWGSCSHKKIVAGAIFTLVWNLSSLVARVWAVFVLFVAVRYYQQYVGHVEDPREGEDARASADKESQDEDMTMSYDFVAQGNLVQD